MTTEPSASAASETNAESNRADLRFLVGGHTGTVGAIAFSAVIAGFAEAAVLATVAQVAAALLSGADSIHIGVGPLDLTAGMSTLIWASAALVLVRLALLGLNLVLQAQLSAKVQAEIRDRLFGAFTHASWGVQSRDAEGHLQEMLTSQALQASWGTIQVGALISAVFTFVVLLISAMLLNVIAAALVIVVSGVIWALLRPLSALGQRRSKELSQAQMNYAGGVGEAVRLAEESHVFGVTFRQREALERLVKATEGLVFRSGLVNRFAPMLFQSLIYLTVVAGLGALYWTGAGAVASLGAVVLLLIRAGTYGQQIQGCYQLIRQALPFVERLREATGRYEDNRVEPGSEHLPAISRLEFKDVSYAYQPGQPVLQGIDFHVAHGEVVGIIGPSGAGKSTMVQLLLQLRTPDDGEYRLNGVRAGSFAPEDWHREVAYVPQEPRLLHASVADNIRYFREIDDATIEKAAKMARVHDEIVGWENGYETKVGPRADSVSGGQQQRICLARALASNPTLLVLDEPTSALDPRSESLIQDSLHELAGEITVFIVTHRMSTLTVCDRVMVVANHQLEGFGTPEELKATNPYFRAALDFSTGAQPFSEAPLSPRN